jgi:hypothetical protein
VPAEEGSRTMTIMIAMLLLGGALVHFRDVEN